MRIYLIGFMASGKTNRGKLLARRLGYHFCDLDALVQQRTGCSPTQLFAQSEQTFRLHEQAALHHTFTYQNTVIACGGGTPCFYDNMNAINQAGTSIYIHCTPKVLHARLLAATKPRPLIAQLNPEQLMDFITQRLALRLPYYAQAHHTVNAQEELLQLGELLKNQAK